MLVRMRRLLELGLVIMLVFNWCRNELLQVMHVQLILGMLPLIQLMEIIPFLPLDKKNARSTAYGDALGTGAY